jgi:hypothetical protein
MPNNNAPQPPATPTPATPTAKTVTNAKTAAELWNALYRWATAVLPKKVKVVKSHQDMASVKGTFICINYAGSWSLAGSNASKMIDNRPDLPSPRVFVYRGTVEIREVEGDGDFLMQLLESLDRPEYQYLLNDAGLSVLKAEGPQEMPSMQQAQWRKESLLTLTMSWVRAYEGSTLTIESVEISQVKTFGTIDDEENLVVDAQQNIVQGEELYNEFTVAT